MEPVLNPPSPAGQTPEETRELPFAAANMVFCSSPMHLSAAAHLYGVRSVPLQKARVLELGCAQGENLLPFALAYPEAQVVGVDASPDAVEAGQQRAQALGAANLRLCVADLTTIGVEFGEFDYIIAHGIYGRAPAEISQAVLRICRQNLSELGIAYVSYNTYPGWKANDILRDAMLLHARTATSDTELIGAARAAARLLFDTMPPDSPFGAALKQAAERVGRQSDAELASDYLVGSSSACYFAEFAAVAQQMQLAHIGDAQPQQEMALAYGIPVSLNHTLIALGQPKLMRQQYLDFMVSRELRRSMLVREEREHEALAVPEPARLADLRLAATFTRLPNIKPQGATGRETFVYRSFYGESLSTTDATLADVMNILSHAWPATVTFDRLLRSVSTRPYDADADTHRKAVLKAVTTLFNWKVLRYSLGAGPYDGTYGKGGGLRLLPGVAQVLPQARPEEQAVPWFNLWHEAVTLQSGSAARALVAHIDGKNGFSRLSALMRAVMEQGGVDSTNDDPSPDGTALGDLAAWRVAGVVDDLKRLGLVHAGNDTWNAYFSEVLDAAPDDSQYWYPYPGALAWHARAAAEAGVPTQAVAKRKTGGQQRQKAPSLDKLKEFDRLYARGAYPEALALARQLARQFPDGAKVWLAVGSAAMQANEPVESVVALRKALSRSPLDATIHAVYGLTLAGLGMAAEAETCYRQSLMLDPNNANALTNMGSLLWTRERKIEATVFRRKVLEVRPNSALDLSNMGNVLMDAGQLTEAAAVYRKALALQPDHFAAFSNLLFLLVHDDEVVPAELFQEHCRFGRMAEKKVGGDLPPLLGHSRDPGKKLRLGFVSADLYFHAVTNFLAPVWRGLDRESFEIYAYNASTFADEITARMKEMTAVWRDVAGMAEDDLARQVREDGVDILFDLSGHTSGNRLLMFARRAAPLQVAWIGYPGTTGLTTMDYCLIDSHVAPVGHLDPQFTEKLVYIPEARTFQPHPNSPPPGPLPALKNGYLTFGNFNRASKLGDRTLDLWGRVLQAVPTARMLLGNMEDDEMRETLAARFAQRGISQDRLIFKPRATMAQYLAFHQEVDLIIDTFPYTGGTTTCHALWMGVPVLTLRGETRASCQSAGILGSAKMTEWVTATPDEFVVQALQWAGNVAGLAEVRDGMRARLMESPLCASRDLVRGVQAAMRQMWQRWCDGLAPASFTVDSE